MDPNRESDSPSEVAKQFEHFRPALVRMAARSLGRDLQARVDPSDVVQEALVCATLALPQRNEAGESPLFVWLCRLVRERLVDAQRFHTRKLRSIHREWHRMVVVDDGSWIRPVVETLADDTAGPGSRVARKERLMAIESAISALPEEHRELIRLKYEDGLKTHEIAEALGITEAAVKMRHVRIIESLRSVLLDDEL